MNGSVTGSYGSYVKRRDFFQVFPDHISEGHHDLGVVAFCCLVDTRFIGSIEIGSGNVRAKKITAEQNLVFL